MGSWVAVPVTPFCLKPCRALFRITEDQSQFFMLEEHIFHITSTRPTPMYYPTPFGSITILVQVISTRRCPSWNINFLKLTSFSHRCVSGFFSPICALSPSCRSSVRIPDVPNSLPMGIPLIATMISSLPGGSSGISTSWNSIGIGALSGVHQL